jgi:hypothetical protein
MYLRFVTPLIHPDTGVESGFFRAYWYLFEIKSPEWIISELEGQFDWFKTHLAKPERLRGSRGRTVIPGVCWFLQEAREYIDRGRYCAWLFSEAGLPVEMIRLRRPAPNDLIWSDGRQAVITAWRSPRAFSGKPLRMEGGW